MTTQKSNNYEKIPLVFNVNKPVGISSFHVVHHFKKNLNFDFGKIGHFGTLDPFAEGVLLIGIQGAQKMNDYVHRYLPKTYQALGTFGPRTTSGDFTTSILETKDIEQTFQNMKKEELENLLQEKYLGEYWQSPHAISATKYKGKRLYQYALEGKLIQKEKVKREIENFVVIEYSYPFLKFEVTVSSGTYVRSLFEEIAELMGGFGALKELKRVAIGNLKLTDSLDESQWPLKDKKFNLEAHGQPLNQLFPLNTVLVNNILSKKYLQGQPVSMSDLHLLPNENTIYSQNLVWSFSECGYLYGLGKIENGKLLTIFNLKEAIALFS